MLLVLVLVQVVALELGDGVVGAAAVVVGIRLMPIGF